MELEAEGNYSLMGEQAETIRVVGFGRGKKLAQHHAAYLMLKEKYKMECTLPIGAGVLTTNLKVPSNQIGQVKQENGQQQIDTSPKGVDYLILFNQRHPGKDLEFRKEGTDKDTIFICECEERICL